jgi:hypothetical protein
MTARTIFRVSAKTKRACSFWENVLLAESTGLSPLFLSQFFLGEGHKQFDALEQRIGDLEFPK